MNKGKGDMNNNVSYNQGAVDMPLVLLSLLMKHDLFYEWVYRWARGQKNQRGRGMRWVLVRDVIIKEQ